MLEQSVFLQGLFPYEAVLDALVGVPKAQVASLLLDIGLVEIGA